MNPLSRCGEMNRNAFIWICLGVQIVYPTELCYKMGPELREIALRGYREQQDSRHLMPTLKNL